MTSDAALLQQYALNRDANAFAEMVRRYADMVYAICLRITRNAHDAEDVAQECFLALARSAGSISTSLAGWLHSIATTRSLNVLRDASTRRRHEEAAMNQKSSNAEPTWPEIAPLVDQALEDLSEELRAPLVLHYLQRRSQSEIADELGVNQGTVSRRLDKGLAELRERLKRAGVVASVATLTVLLTGNAASAAPVSLATALGKMALAGIGKATVGSAAAGGVGEAVASTAASGTLYGKLAAAAVVAALVVAGGIVYKEATRPRPPVVTARAAEHPASPYEKSEPERTRIMEKTRLRQAGGKVWIEGLEKFWLEGVARQQNSVMASLTVALRAVGEDVTYEYLMGVSGAAFRLQISQPDWCPEAPFAGVGFNCTSAAMRAVGRKLAEFGAKEGDAEAEGKRRDAIVESINKGYPVLFLKEEGGLVVGYVDGGKTFLRSYYLDRTDGYVQFDKWSWAGAGIIGEKKQVPPRRENLLRSLEIAMELANTPRYDKFASGFAAYEVWISGLLDESGFEKMDKEKLRTTTLSNAWCYVSLVDARGAAVRYLLSIEEEFKGDAAAHLAKAADLYDEIHMKLSEGRENAPFPQDLQAGERWTKEMRQAQARLLRESLAQERKAVGELKAALAIERRAP